MVRPAQPNTGSSVIRNTAMRHRCSYDPSHVNRGIVMERFLLLWDELDDLVGTSRYYVKNTAMAIWSSVRHRP